MKKLIKIVVLLLLLLVIAVVVGVHFFLDSAVKKAVETVGPQVTGVSVKLNSASISLLSGSASLNGLAVGNPQGFKSPSSISLAKSKIQVKPTSVFSDKIIINSIVLDAPEISFEQTLSGNNLLKIKGNLNSGDSKPETSPKEKKSSIAGKKLQVDEFLITNGKVHVLATLPVVGEKAMTVPLPTIRFKDLGQSANGITASELSAKVLNEIIKVAIEEGERAVKDLGKNSFIMGGKGIGTNISGKITEGIDGLFKKKK